MSREPSKKRCVRLDGDAYRQLHRQVLERDGWRCQNCGSMRGLEVHHLKFRSRAGDDAEHNLITLCQACHSSVHNSNPRSFWSTTTQATAEASRAATKRALHER